MSENLFDGLWTFNTGRFKICDLYEISLLDNKKINYGYATDLILYY